jgi:hypothetical protein
VAHCAESKLPSKTAPPSEMKRMIFLYPNHVASRTPNETTAPVEKSQSRFKLNLRGSPLEAHRWKSQGDRVGSGGWAIFGWQLVAPASG